MRTLVTVAEPERPDLYRRIALALRSLLDRREHVEYIPSRSKAVKLTAAIHEYLDESYPGDEIPDQADLWLVAWLGVHGDEGTPGMVHP